MGGADDADEGLELLTAARTEEHDEARREPRPGPRVGCPPASHDQVGRERCGQGKVQRAVVLGVEVGELPDPGHEEAVVGPVSVGDHERAGPGTEMCDPLVETPAKELTRSNSCSCSAAGAFCDCCCCC